MSFLSNTKEFYLNNKKKVMVGLSVLSASITMWVASADLTPPNITVNTAMTEAQTQLSFNLLWKLMSFVASFFYTLADLFITFFTQNTVLWILVFLAVVYFVYKRVFIRWRNAF